jgi:hypothetical protein
MSIREKSSTASEVKSLADRLEINDVLHRYALALDSRDWELLRSCFTADAVAVYFDPADSNEGVDAIVARCWSALQGLDASQHMIGTALASVDGDTASATCYLHAQHVFRGAPGGDHYLIAGRYEDRLVRTDAGWRIQHRTLHFSWSRGNQGVFPAAAERLKASGAQAP